MFKGALIPFGLGGFFLIGLGQFAYRRSQFRVAGLVVSLLGLAIDIFCVIVGLTT